jgi:hypothetical protein
MQAATIQLLDTRRLITTNFTLFKQFYTIFTGLKDLVESGTALSQTELL